MSWRDYFPWTSGDESQDSSRVTKVKDRCDHEWSDWQLQEGGHETLDGMAPAIENGYMVFYTMGPLERFCRDCGKRQTNLQRFERVAIEIDYRLGDDVEISDLPEDPDEEPGRVLVNQEIPEGSFEEVTPE